MPQLSLLCIAGKVEDLDSGEYRAYFSATVAGSYAVSAMLKGKNIAGSPFAATVTAVEVDAGCSYAAGDGVTAACSGHPVRATSLPCHMREHMIMPLSWHAS